GQRAAEGQISKQIETSVGPTVAEAVQQTLQSASSKGGMTTASIVGVVLLLFGASGVFVQLQSSLNTIWGCPPKSGGGVRGFFRSRLLSFLMVLGVGFLLLVSLAVGTSLTAASSYLAPQETSLYQVLNQF